MRGAFTATILFAAALMAQDCPVQFTEVSPEVEQSWSRVGRSLSAGGAKNLPPDFRVKFKNTSGKDIRGMKLAAAYFDAVEDLHPVPVAWNLNNTIKRDGKKTADWENTLYHDTAFIGWVVWPTKILFEDGTRWEMTESSLHCFGEYWRDKHRPRLTALPQSILESNSDKKE